MKRLLLILVITAALVSPALAEVEWVPGPFPEILKKAQLENKYIFIDFYAVWCGPCKMLEKTTYLDEKVETFLNSIVAVKYDAEKGEGKELAQQFKVKAYPTLILLDAKGNEIDRHLGYLDGENFLKVMKDYQKGIGTIGYYEAELNKKPDDLATLFNLGEKYTNIFIEDKAVAHLSKIISLDPGNAGGYTDKAYFNLGDLYLSGKKYELAVTNFQTLINKYPQSGQHDYAFQMLARTYEKMGNTEKCVETYKAFVEKNPNDPKTLNAFAWFCASRKVAMDEAIPYAERAVDLSDGDPGFMDTLAELYFAKGDFAKALEIEEEASAKDPEDGYLKDQIIKYLKASLEEAKGTLK
jgi:thioredoxin 1